VDPVPERVLHLTVRPSSGGQLDASIFIDSSIRGRCSGGLSLSSEKDPALLSRVAHVRTLQHGLLGVPVGGAAAFIRAPLGTDHGLKMRLLDAFSEAAGPFISERGFVPIAEIGFSDSDVDDLLTRCGNRRLPQRMRSDAGDHVGVTVALSAVNALRRAKIRPDRATASVEGFGKVGSNVALELHERGIKVVAVSTREGALFDADGLDVPELVPLAERAGDGFVRKYSEADRLAAVELRSLSVDLFCPCALPGGVDAQAAGRLRCRVVVPGATVPLRPGGERMLEGRGVAYVPDLLSTSGGVLGARLARAGYTPNGQVAFIERHFSSLLEWLEGLSDREGMELGEFVEAYSLERFARMKTDAEKAHSPHDASSVALWAHANRLLPAALVRRLATRSIEIGMSPDGTDSALVVEWAGAGESV